MNQSDPLECGPLTSASEQEERLQGEHETIQLVGDKESNELGYQMSCFRRPEEIFTSTRLYPGVITRKSTRRNQYRERRLRAGIGLKKNITTNTSHMAGQDVGSMLDDPTRAIVKKKQ